MKKLLILLLCLSGTLCYGQTKTSFYQLKDTPFVCVNTIGYDTSAITQADSLGGVLEFASGTSL